MTYSVSAENVSGVSKQRTLINDDVRPWHAAEAGGIILAHQELVRRQHNTKLRLSGQHLRHRHPSRVMERVAPGASVWQAIRLPVCGATVTPNLRREERLARLCAALVGKHGQGGGPGGQLGLPVWQQRRRRHDQPGPALAARLSQVREERYDLP